MSDFFKRENPLLTFFIVFGLFGLIPCMLFAPEYLIILGPFGEFCQKVVRENPEETWKFFKYCIYVHFSEAAIAFVIAALVRGMTIKTSLKWTFNVFIHGVFSLRHLIWS